MKTVCDLDRCAGCMACVELCSKNAIIVKEDMESYNAVIDEQKCVNCNACLKVCPNNNPAPMRIPQKWYQGWANESEVRAKGSSGGIASALSKRMILEGGIVWSCAFEKGVFGFKKAETVGELYRFADSKYVKSNPIGAYKSIRHDLALGKKVLFIGLPCQVASLRNFVGVKLEAELTTVDLICHGTPSLAVLEFFLSQYDYRLSDLKDIKFRKKTHYQIFAIEKDKGNYIGITPNGVTDRYLIAFLNCLIYTRNCYSCNYAKTERVSDITLGDSWGSNLSETEQEKGISLILCQSKKGMNLVEQSELHLENVDIENAILKNHQLREPSKKPECREQFLKRLKAGEEFDKLVYEYYPKQCKKQELKRWLIKLYFIKGAR